jgi:hypothetical protein
MQVKVQYTVDLEDVPKEVIKLLPKLLDYTPEVAHIERLITEGKTVKAIEALGDFRRSLYRADQRLVDSQTILKGYLNITSEPPSNILQPEAEVDSAS